MLACAAGAPYSHPANGWPPSLPSGSFVELGAFDGVINSNTFMLERCYAWTGLLIEASPSNYQKLITSSNRTASMVHSAICAAPGGVLVVSADGRQMGGEVELIPNQTMRRYGQKLNLASSVVTVPCAPLSGLMHRAGLRDGADFLSLDVEGAEVKVLQTIDPALFKVVLVETNVGSGGVLSDAENAKNAHVHQLLTRASLVRVRRLGNLVNHAYVRRDVLERCSHAVNRTCSDIQHTYQLPLMDCKRHHNFQDEYVSRG